MCNILIEFGIPTKLVTVIEVLSRIYGKVHICKHLSDAFPV